MFAAHINLKQIIRLTVFSFFMLLIKYISFWIIVYKINYNNMVIHTISLLYSYYIIIGRFIFFNTTNDNNIVTLKTSIFGSKFLRVSYEHNLKKKKKLDTFSIQRITSSSATYEYIFWSVNQWRFIWNVILLFVRKQGRRE